MTRRFIGLTLIIALITCPANGQIEDRDGDGDIDIDDLRLTTLECLIGPGDSVPPTCEVFTIDDLINNQPNPDQALCPENPEFIGVAKRFVDAIGVTAFIRKRETELCRETDNPEPNVAAGANVFVMAVADGTNNNSVVDDLWATVGFQKSRLRFGGNFPPMTEELLYTEVKVVGDVTISFFEPEPSLGSNFEYRAVKFGIGSDTWVFFVGGNQVGGVVSDFQWEDRYAPRVVFTCETVGPSDRVYGSAQSRTSFTNCSVLRGNDFVTPQPVDLFNNRAAVNTELGIFQGDIVNPTTVEFWDSRN